VSERSVRSHPHPSVVGGRYRLLGEVGRGGMAIVHRAHDEVLHREVAVKLLHAHLAQDPAFLDRFRREARAAAALAHPNVVAVHDWGETEQGPYLVLQLVEGVTLRDVLRQQRQLTAAETLGALGPVAQGLAAAHRAGLVHRDVKPENVLLARSGAVQLTDFGLARAAASATSTFGPDVLVGSPHYLSPEAVRGLPLDPRADVYALGVVLFECLTGRPPHEGESPFATALAHTTRRVPAPSGYVADVGDELDAVVERATAIERDRRFPDAAAFGRALHNAVPQPAAQVALPVVPPPVPAARTGGTVVVDAGALRSAARSAAPTGRAHSLPPPAPAGTGLATTSVTTTPDTRGSTGRSEPTIVVPPEEHDTDDLRPERDRSRAWLVVVLLLALLGGSAAGGYLLWDRVLAPITPVPDVLSAQLDAAQDQLERAGFVVRVAPDQPFDLAVPAGAVLSQEPRGVARAGSEVMLVLSSGPRPVEVPAVAGEDADDAVAVLRDAGLDPVVDRRYDDDVADGVVIGTEPRADEVVDEASEVTVVVSRGPEPIELPDVRGATEDDAVARLEGLGLRPEVTDRRADEDRAAGTVLGQGPGPGTTLQRGDRVTLVVSDGPAPVEVPSVRGMRVGDAVAELASLGLEVEVERRGGFGALLNPDRVYDQSPAPEALVERGSVVVLYAYS
jgi:eukaryotic-like serine/threonine-protein kinase